MKIVETAKKSLVIIQDVMTIDKQNSLSYEGVDVKCLYGFRVWVKDLQLKLNLTQGARIFCEIKQKVIRQKGK